MEVLENDPGVQRLLSGDNRIEVISIGPPRLQNDLKQKDWLVISETSVEVLSDQVGGYRIYVLQPEVSFTELNNVYLATEQHDPSQPFRIRFYLQDKKGQIILDPQPIQGYIALPEGEKSTLRIPSSLSPDDQGVYEISFDFKNNNVSEFCEASRFTFNLNAGIAEEQAEEHIPIAKADIYVDVAPLVKCTPTPTPTPSPEEEIIASFKIATVSGIVLCCLIPRRNKIKQEEKTANIGYEVKLFLCMLKCPVLIYVYRKKLEKIMAQLTLDKIMLEASLAEAEARLGVTVKKMAQPGH